MSVLTARESIDRGRAAQIGWAETSPADRARVLTRLRHELAANREQLVSAIVNDTGKPALDALGGDVLVTLEQMRFYERHAANLLRPRRVGRSLLFYRGCRFTEILEPHGVALVFGPANYPLQLSLVPAITALYAGNAVVLKVSERAPLVARLIEQVVSKADLPLHLFQVIYANPDESRGLIEAKPDFIFFTGSTFNGRSVAAAAAARGIPTLLELGGSDPAIVFADCNFERAVEGILYGAFSNAGQVCVGVKRVLIEQPLHRRFLSELVRRTALLRIGPGQERDLGEITTEAQRRLLEAQVLDALDRGAHVETDPAGPRGAPVILSNVSPQARLLREEAFGPVVCVQPFIAESRAIGLANASPFALGASIWTTDLERGHRIAQQLNAGNCSINDVISNIANPYAAFGGNAASGHGRYHGAHGLQAFSRTKTIMVNSSSRQREINWFPLTQKKYDGLDSLIAWRHTARGVWSALRRAVHLSFFLAILAQSLPINSQSAHLMLQVHLPKGTHGPVAYLVFNSPDGFPQDKSKAVSHGISEPVQNVDVKTIDVGELPPGRYAVSAYLDENNNGKLDSGLFGIPKEPVGVSNNPPHRMGPPHFQDAAFTLDTATQTISIELVRP